MIRAMSLLFSLLALGLLTYAGYRYAVDSEPRSSPTLNAENPERDLGSQPCDAPIAVSFRISNPSSQPIRIVGLVPG